MRQNAEPISTRSSNSTSSVIGREEPYNRVKAAEMVVKEYNDELELIHQETHVSIQCKYCVKGKKWLIIM